jgi:chemotaxis protein CheX
MYHEILVKEIRTATHGVFSTMLGIEVEPGVDSLETAGAGPVEGVSALVGLAGKFSGTGSISCSATLACRLAGAMLMSEFSFINDEVLDAMGEIANMIVGNIKTNLELTFGPMGLSIPTVVYGRNFCTRTLGKHSWTVLHFQCEGESFQVQMMVAEAVPVHPMPKGVFPALQET